MSDERTVAPGAGVQMLLVPRRWSRESFKRSARELWHRLKTAAGLFSDINGTVWAASFSYYAFFALVPLLVLLVTLTTDFAARFVGEETAQARAYEYVVTNIPLGPEGRGLLGETIHGVLRSRGQIGVVALAGLIWSSLGFFQSLVSSVNQAFRQQPLNWWRLPLRNLMMLVVLASALLLGNVLPVVLKTLQGYVTFGRIWVPVLFGFLGYLGSAAVLFYGFVLFYRFAPRRATGITFRGAAMPALIVTILLQVAQAVFVLYSTRFANFNAVYGAFGGVIALMLWTYLSGTVVVFGGCLCAASYHPDDHAKKDAGALKPAA